MEVNGYRQLYPSSAFICLVTSILQNIFFCVQQKKETHKQVEGEKIMTEFSFLIELSLSRPPAGVSMSSTSGHSIPSLHKNIKQHNCFQYW